MKPDKVSIAIVGCGVVTRRHHLPVLNKNPFVNISLLCDTNSEATKFIVNRFKLDCRVVDNVDEVASSQDIDAVFINTPGPTHYEIALKLLSAGKNLLIEKPPVKTPAELENLNQIAAEKGLKVGAVFNNRHRPIIERLVKIIKSGVLGKIVKVNILHHANLVYAESPWLWDEKNSQYLVYEFGIHFFDLLTMLLGEHEKLEYIKIFERPEIKQTTEIQVGITFKSGAFAHVAIAQDTTRHSTNKTIIDIFGTGMDAHIRFFPPLIRLSSGMEDPVNLLFSEAKSFSNLLRLILTGKWTENRNHGHKIIIREFINWIKGEADFNLTLHQILPTIRLLYEIAKQIPAYS